MSTEILEIFRQMSFVSSVLAGFGIAVAIELIALARKDPLTSSTIAVFLVSSVITLLATVIFVFVMSSTLSPPGSPRPDDEWIVHFVGGIGILPFFGFVLFLIGIGLIGWIHSKLIGIITSVSAMAAVLLVIYVMRIMTTFG
jgi:hypothetical protein